MSQGSLTRLPSAPEAASVLAGIGRGSRVGCDCDWNSGGHSWWMPVVGEASTCCRHAGAPLSRVVYGQSKQALPSELFLPGRAGQR